MNQTGVSKQQKPDEAWAELVRPYRDAALRLGLAELGLRVAPFPGDEFSCVNFFVSSDRQTFVDLSGTVLLGGRRRGVSHGFQGAQLTTFLRLPNGEIDRVWSFAEAAPRPFPHGCVAMVLQLLEPLLRKGLPEGTVAPPLRTVEDLGAVLGHHRGRLGTGLHGEILVAPEAKEAALEARWRWTDELEGELEESGETESL